MTKDTMLDAIGLMDEDFLEASLTEGYGRKKILSGRFLRNLAAAVMAVAVLGCVVFATQMPEAQKPTWEPYADADTMLDILFGTGRYTPDEGMVQIQKKLVGTMEDGTAHYEEVRIPVTSSASREPVSEGLAALVKPYIIPVGQSVVDPTGTITLEVMAYFYEPESQCGAVYLKLTDPAGEFCGYVPEDPGVVQNLEEEIDTRKGIEIYLQQFTRKWGKPWAGSWPMHMRLVEELSNETTWTYVAYFFCDNYDTVDMDIGFKTEPMVDHRPYRIDIDLERTPTMETVVLGNVRNKELVTVSPAGIRIDGDAISDHWRRATEVVIHFRDGSTYLVVDEENCIYGYARRANDLFAFANILDINQISSVEVNGIRYYTITWW